MDIKMFEISPRRAISGFLSLFSIMVFADGSRVHAQEPADYRVVDQQKIGGVARWDYLVVDGLNRNLFITHGDQVDVFNVEKNQIIGHIVDTHGVHGVALAQDLNRGFTSNGKDNSVTVFDLKSLEKIGKIHTGKKPDAIFYDDFSRQVFTGNGESSSLTAIDAKNGKFVLDITLGGQPEFIAVDGKGHLFVNLEDKNQLAVVNTRTLKLERKYDLSASCDGPSGLSMDQLNGRLFVGCHNKKMLVVDSETGKILDAIDIGGGNDATAYDAETGLAFSSNGDGTLNVVHSDDAKKYRLQQTVATMKSARTMAIDPVTRKIYLVAVEYEMKNEKSQAKQDSFTLITVSK